MSASDVLAPFGNTCSLGGGCGVSDKRTFDVYKIVNMPLYQVSADEVKLNFVESVGSEDSTALNNWDH